MKLIGLTGGIGMGKSTAAEYLQRHGLPVADTDLFAREVAEPGQPALEEIREVFGGEVISPEGWLRRDRMAQVIFADAAKRKALEGIMHPRIRRRWHEVAATWRARGVPAGVVVIPLLFETKAEPDLDYVVCVACSPATQRQRLLARGFTPEQIEQRNQAQWPIEKKMAAAHFVVWNEGSLEVPAGQLDRILARILPSPTQPRPKGCRL